MKLLKRFARYILQRELLTLRAALDISEQELLEARNLSAKIEYHVSRDTVDQWFRELENMVVVSNTTPTQAAYLVGIARSKEHIRSKVGA